MQFLTPVDFCHDTACLRTLVPWIASFELLAENDTIAILSQDSGEYKQGLYVKQQGRWNLVLNYADLCTSLSDDANLEVVVSLSLSTAIPATSKAYRNGYRVQGAVTIDPSPNVIWVVATIQNGAVGNSLPITDMFGTPVANFVVL